MLNIFGFGASKKAETTTLINEDIAQIFKTLTKEQKAKIFLALPVSSVVNCFFNLDLESQKYIFPLLSGPIRSEVEFTSRTVNSDLKNTLNEQLNAFNDHEKNFLKNKTSPESFFFAMNKNHSLVSMIDNQITYSISADKIIDFDLKSFKYQRKLMQRHIDTIANGLEKSLKFYHPITLAVEDESNTISILDGQHRWNALKKIDRSLLSQIDLQFNVIYFNGVSDSDIMKVYKNINTSVPIDPKTLSREMDYINLVDDIKKAFPKDCIRSFNKELKEKDDYPQNFIIDSFLKEELQYVKVLDYFNCKEIISKLQVINEEIKSNETEAINNLSIGETKNITRNNFYLAIKWPSCINSLVKKIN